MLCDQKQFLLQENYIFLKGSITIYLIADDNR